MDNEHTDFWVKDGSPSQWIVGLVYVHPLVMAVILLIVFGGYNGRIDDFQIPCYGLG